MAPLAFGIVVVIWSAVIGGIYGWRRRDMITLQGDNQGQQDTIS